MTKIDALSEAAQEAMPGPRATVSASDSQKPHRQFLNTHDETVILALHERINEYELGYELGAQTAEAERDEWKREYERCYRMYGARIDELRAERDAFAARVENITPYIKRSEALREALGRLVEACDYILDPPKEVSRGVSREVMLPYTLDDLREVLASVRAVLSPSREGTTEPQRPTEPQPEEDR